MGSPVFSLPRPLVEDAREERESSWLSEIGSGLDATVKSGMSALGTVAGGVAETLSPFAQALQQGGLSVPSLEDLTPEWMQGAQAKTAAEPPDVRPFTLNPSPSTPTAPGLSVPDLASPARQRAPALAGMGAVTAGADTSAPSDVNDYLRYAASKAGVDPAQVLAVMGKEGPTGWGSVGRFDTGTSYGPLQLHYAGGANPKEGMGDRFTRATGIDLRQDSSIAAHQAAVDFAMQELVKRGDWSEWYGAEPAFPASAGGQGRFTPVKRVAPSQPAAVSAPPPLGAYTAETLTPTVNQLTQGRAENLSTEEALALCGPAAAMAFARANHRNPTLREARDLAQSLGLWDVSVGMRGPQAELALLEKLGVPARLEQGADEALIAREVQAGRPAIIDLPQHYMVAVGYDPATRQFEFGESAKVLKAAGGRSRFRLDELASLGMGAPRSSIFMGAGG